MKLLVTSRLVLLYLVILFSCHTKEDRVTRYNNGSAKYSYHLVDHLQSGKSISYYINKQVKSVSSWDKGKQNGKTYLYYQSGELQKITYWKAGLLDGPFYSFYKNGKPAIRSTWKNGNKIGWTYEYFVSGIIKKKYALTNDSARVVILYNEKGRPVEKHIENKIGKLIYVSSYDKTGKEELGFIIPSYEGEKYNILNRNTLLDTLYLNRIHPIKMIFGFRFNNKTKLVTSSYKQLNRDTDTLSAIIKKSGLYFLIRKYKQKPGYNTIYYKFICSGCNDTLAAESPFGSQIGSHTYFIKR